MRIHVNKAENKLFRTKHVTHKLPEKFSMEIIKRVIKVFLLIWRSDLRSSIKIFFQQILIALVHLIILTTYNGIPVNDNLKKIENNQLAKYMPTSMCYKKVNLNT